MKEERGVRQEKNGKEEEKDRDKERWGDSLRELNLGEINRRGNY